LKMRIFMAIFCPDRGSGGGHSHLDGTRDVDLQDRL
jgi:hypothetical protein